MTRTAGRPAPAIAQSPPPGRRGLSLRCLTLLLLIAPLTPLPAVADGIATLESSRGNRLLEMTIHWAEDRMRLDIPSLPAGYLLRRDDAAYLVSDLNNRLVVINLTNLRRLADQRRDGQAPHLPRHAAALEVLEPLHKQEAVGGIQGEFYRLRWIDAKGLAHEERMVVSDHPLAVELLEGMQAYYRALSDRPDPIISDLVKRELGMLRFAGRFRLLSISGEAPDETLFELPGGARVMEAFEAQDEAEATDRDTEKAKAQADEQDAPAVSPPAVPP